MNAPKGKFTQLLNDWRTGQGQALSELTPLVYEELRRLAHRYMRGERGSHTLQATAVVHEAFLRLIQSEVPMQDRTHFFALASRLMRRVLVDHARNRSRGKRSGNVHLVPLEEAPPIKIETSFDIVDLDHGLDQLEQLEPRLAQTLELHYFGELTYDQIALAMKCSAATVHRDIRLARAWLLDFLMGYRV
ncbi:MAG: sigma-70 family RNA polymerase sigma factor [Proteobacteria bacterium]|nr:sigma-70 family RNA polymerase sigma factor [Pseudomonadota bacterium]